MLKIKDNYDLQQLTKYGFVKLAYGNMWEYTMFGENDQELCLIVNAYNEQNREIKVNYLGDGDADILGDLTVLYQMIMDGIVEVVE
jgi:hypothetical protein